MRILRCVKIRNASEKLIYVSEKRANDFQKRANDFKNNIKQMRK